MMNRLVILLSILSLTLSSINAQPLPQTDDTQRIMSYNIRAGRGMDNKVDIERIGRAIVDVNPQVVGLQEVDSVVKRSGNVDIMKVLSQQTGMYATFGYSIPIGEGKYGNGILTKEKPISIKKLSLPGKKEARTALIVELKEFVVVNTHLSLKGDERLESVKIITESVSEYQKPIFLMGDLNAKPNDAPIKWLEDAKWHILSDTTQATFPSNNPKNTIDYILGYEGKGNTYETHQAQVIENSIASDHRPLFIDVKINSGK